jgi:hypothetical protein
MLFIRNQTFGHEVEGIFSLIRRRQKKKKKKLASEMECENHKKKIWNATVAQLAVLSSDYLEENENKQGDAGILGVMTKREISFLPGTKPRW